MIISRHVYAVREGRIDEIIEHCKWWKKEFAPPPRGYRIYTLIKGDSEYVMVDDEEFVDREEWRAHGDRVHRDPGFAEAIRKYRELAEIKHELWEVVDQG